MATAPAISLGARPVLQDWLFIARLANEQAQGNYPGTLRYLDAPEIPADVVFNPGNPGNPGVLWADYDGWSLISCTGTANAYQWINHILNVRPAPSPFWAGNVGLYFQGVAFRTWNVISQKVLSAKQGLVFVGHSMGAATAILLAQYALSQFAPVLGAYGIGCPQIGDQTFADRLTVTAYTLGASDDPVAVLPPAESYTLVLPSSVAGVLPFKIPKPTTFGGYAPQATQLGMTAGGVLTPDFFSQYLNGAQAIYDLVTGNYEGHLSATYIQRLCRRSVCADKVTGAGGYDSPFLLWNLDDEPDCSPAATAPTPAQVLDAASLNAINALRCWSACFPPFSPSWSS